MHNSDCDQFFNLNGTRNQKKKKKKPTNRKQQLMIRLLNPIARSQVKLMNAFKEYRESKHFKAYDPWVKLH